MMEVNGPADEGMTSGLEDVKWPSETTLAI